MAAAAAPAASREEEEEQEKDIGKKGLSGVVAEMYKLERKARIKSYTL